MTDHRADRLHRSSDRPRSTAGATVCPARAADPRPGRRRPGRRRAVAVFRLGSGELATPSTTSTRSRGQRAEPGDRRRRRRRRRRWRRPLYKQRFDLRTGRCLDDDGRRRASATRCRLRRRGPAPCRAVERRPVTVTPVSIGPPPAGRSTPASRPRRAAGGGPPARAAGPRRRGAVPLRVRDGAPASAATPARWRAPSRTACRRARCGGGWARSRAATTPTPGASTCRCRATTASTPRASTAAPPTPTRSSTTASSPTTPTTASAASTAPGTARTRCRRSSPTGASSPSATCACPGSRRASSRRACRACPTHAITVEKVRRRRPGGPTTPRPTRPQLPSSDLTLSTTRIELPDDVPARDVRRERLEPPPRAPPLAARVAHRAHPGGPRRQRHRRRPPTERLVAVGLAGGGLAGSLAPPRPARPWPGRRCATCAARG